MTTIPSGLTVRRMDPSDEASVVALLTASLGGGPTGSRTTDFFRWKHRNSPFGASPGLVALDHDRIVGVRLFLRWRLSALGESLQAVRAVDTATHPSFQGRGIFRQLTLDLLRMLEETGEVDLVFNTPNQSSKPGYLKMGWREVGTVPVHIGVNRPLRFLRGVRTATAATAASSRSAPGDTATTNTPLAECTLPKANGVLAERASQLDGLLAEISPASGVHTPRSPEFLQWRYGDAPGLDYRAIAIDSATGLRALAFGRVRQRGLLTEFTLADVLTRDGDTRAAREILSVARGCGTDHVTTHLAPSVTRSAWARGYVSVPRYGLGLVVNPRRELPFDPYHIGSWDLTLGDLEVF